MRQRDHPRKTCKQIRAALAGLGLVYAPEGHGAGARGQGQTASGACDWCQPYPGYHLFYPSRRQSSAAFSLVVDALRYRP
jgi:DNA-binding transcriptional LysR family regulator